MGEIISTTPADESDCCCFCEDDAAMAQSEQVLRVAPLCLGCGAFTMTPAYVDNTTTGPPWAWNLGNAFEYNGGPFQPHCWLGCSVSVTCDEATRKWTLAINAGLYRLYVESQPYYCNFGLTSIIPLHVNDDGYFQGQLEVHVPLNLDTSSPYCETECVVNLTFNPDLGAYRHS